MLCTIVGAGPGLGAAIAHRFARGGCRVALVARRQATTAGIAEELKALGHDARGFTGDAARSESLREAFEAIGAWGGETRVLVYNAAAMSPGLASGLTARRIATEMSTNLGGAVACVGRVLPAMRARGAGTILLTSGGLALEPYPEWASLAAGKAALRAYAAALYKELAPEGIHVAAIAVCGLVEAGGPFDPARVAKLYWQLHAEPPDAFTREVVYLPEGADPYYNDPAGRHRRLSKPIIAEGMTA